MRPITALAASATALIFASAASAQDLSGYIGAGISQTSLDNGVDDDFTGYTLNGGYYNALTGSLNLQVNASFSSYDTDPDSVDVWTGDVALFLRDSSSHAVGVFGSVLDFESGEAWGGGAEGALFLDRWTVGGGAGVFDGEDAFDRLSGGCVYGVVYGSENFALEGRAALADIDYGAVSANGYGVGAGAEYQLMGSGFSLVGGVDHTSLDDINVDTTTFLVGGKVNFGTSGPMQRDRNGAGQRASSCIAQVARF